MVLPHSTRMRCICVSPTTLPGPASTEGSKALPCFHQVWLKGTTCFSLSADEHTDNGFCHCSFVPLEILLAESILEKQEQALLVKSLMHRKAQRSMKWAILRKFGDRFSFAPHSQLLRTGQRANVVCSRESWGSSERAEVG